MKVIVLLLGLQGGYTKYCCFLVNGTVFLERIVLNRKGLAATANIVAMEKKS